MGVVYVIVNKVNGKAYVGQTTRTLDYRIKKHKSSKTPIGNAIAKYGIENFTTFENEIDESLLDETEIDLIKKYNSISPNGYNLDTGGCKNKHQSEETKRKMAESKKGDKNPNYGKELTAETKAKMSISRTGRKNGMFGKKHSAETIVKISNKRSRRQPWNKGLKGVQQHTLESKKKLSEAFSGSKHPRYGLKGELSPNWGKHYIRREEVVEDGGCSTAKRV